MKTMLALDTATDRPTIALGVPGGEVRELAFGHRRDLSRAIESRTAELLKAVGVGVRDLSGIIAADGPGSFTGLRIGAAFAKGVCRAAGIPLLAAPSMLGAARSVLRGRGRVLVQYDALRGDVYRAVYEFGGDHGPVGVVLAPSLAGRDTAVNFECEARADESAASARMLVDLVGYEGAVSEVSDLDDWEPAYGRLAEAEARRLASGG